jgi:hypothetical protein
VRNLDRKNTIKTRANSNRSGEEKFPNQLIG